MKFNNVVLGAIAASGSTVALGQKMRGSKQIPKNSLSNENRIAMNLSGKPIKSSNFYGSSDDDDACPSALSSTTEPTFCKNDYAQCKNKGSYERLSAAGLDVEIVSSDIVSTSPYFLAGYGVSTDLATSSSDCSSDPGKCDKDGYAYACVDWTAGSQSMTTAEADFKARTGQDVYFGVGTEGCLQSANQGGCYRLTYDDSLAADASMVKDLIVQMVNKGDDVACTQFDLQMGVGGQGVFNNCVLQDGDDDLGLSMYAGAAKNWGRVYGGADSKSECSSAPQYPQYSTTTTPADNLQDLCDASFDRGFRGNGDNGNNPSSSGKLLKISQITCPKELTAVTQFRRSDQNSWGYDHATTVNHVDPSAAASFVQSGERMFYDNSDGTNDCGFNSGSPSGGTYCLSRMMDCRKPGGAFIDWNTDQDSVGCDGMSILPACKIDGYTRIASTCGDTSCYW